MMSRSFTRREKILLLVLCFLVLGILYYQFVYKAVDEAIAQYDTADLEIEYQQEQMKANNLANMKEEISTNKHSKIGEIASYNNNKNEIKELNSILSSASSYNIDFSQPVADGEAVRRNINVSFTASGYTRAQAIIDDLHKCKYRCLIRTVSITASEKGVDSGQVSVSLGATFFETLKNATSESGLEKATTNESSTTSTEETE